MTPFPFYLILESIAADCSPYAAIRSLAEKSVEIGIPLKAPINGKWVMVFRNASEGAIKEAVDQWERGIYGCL